MSLSYKDAISTGLTAAVSGLAYVYAKGIHLPIIGSYRVGSTVLLIIGVAMCTFGSSYNLSAPGAWTSPWTITATSLGTLSLILGISGLITGNKIIVLSLVATLVLLWLATTIRHMVV